MGAEFILNIAYWCICALLLLPMIYIIVKSVIVSRNSKDWYSITTFIFLILMLGIRAWTIIPIVIQNEEFNNHDTYWEECIFAATPMIMFSLAVFVHTFRWYHIRNKLENYDSSQRFLKIIVVGTVSINLWFIPIGVSLFWTNNKLSTIQDILSYCIVITYLWMHIFLAIFNGYHFYSFSKGLKELLVVK